MSYDLITFNYPPFMQEDDKGFIDHLLLDFQSHSGIKINTHKYPVKRALKSFVDAKYILHIGATDNFSKEELNSFYIAPIFDLNVYLLYSKPNKEKLSKDLEKLKKIRIGILRGSKQEVDFANKYKFKITTYVDSHNAFNLLKKGRVDFVTFSPLFNNYKDITGANSIDDFSYHHQLCFSSKAAFFINKKGEKSELFYKDFSSKLESYLKSESYKNLLTKFFGEDIPDGIKKYTK